jgi:hypothetical protein
MTHAHKHTLGPWHVVIDDDGNPLSGRPGVFASDELDCGIVHWDGFIQPYWRSARGDKEIHANARLIAAAPELLEALEAIVATWDGPKYNHFMRGNIDRARAAIAKAKGETK